MKHRLDQLKRLLEQLKEESYSQQYGIADMVDKSTEAKAAMDQLAAETALYSRMKNQIAAVELIHKPK